MLKKMSFVLCFMAAPAMADCPCDTVERVCDQNAFHYDPCHRLPTCACEEEKVACNACEEEKEEKEECNTCEPVDCTACAQTERVYECYDSKGYSKGSCELVTAPCSTC